MSRCFRRLIFILLFNLPVAYAESAVDPVSFKAWKDGQIVESQNLLARVNNRLVLLKAGKIRPDEVAIEFNHFAESQPEDSKLTGKAQKLSSPDVLIRLERELARSQKNFEFAKELTLEDYVVGYLSQFQDNSAAIGSVASRLSKDEVSELIRVFLKNSQQSLNSAKPEKIKSALGKLEANARSI